MGKRILHIAAALYWAGITMSCRGISNRPGATPEEGVIDAALIFSSCTGINQFSSFVNSVLASRCFDCHTQGGTGAGKLLFSTATSDAGIAANYVAAMREVRADFGAGTLESNPILSYPLGGNLHQAILSTLDTDTATIADWLNYESLPENACPTVTPGS